MINVNLAYEGNVGSLDIKPELDTTVQAAFSWLDQYIVFKGIIDVEVIIEATSTGRFGGSGSVHENLGIINGFTTWEHASITESRTGIDVDPSTPEFTITIDPYSDYLNGLWWDPTPLSLSPGEIPNNKTDGFSVVLHEIMHGMGINGWLNWDTGDHFNNDQSIWDSLIKVTDDKAYFYGAHTTDLLGEPVEIRLGGSQGAYHLGAVETEQSFLISDIMNGYYFLTGERYLPASLDLAILEDLGWTLKPSASTISNLVDPFETTTPVDDSDTLPPTVSIFEPTDSSTDIALDSNIIVVFDEEIQEGSGFIVLETASGMIEELIDVTSSSNLTISGNTLTINPTNDLSYSTQYYVTLSTDSFKDLAGNGLLETTGYKFTTVAYAPEILSPDRVFNWAENLFPDLLPQHTDSTEIFGYYARVYSNGNALGEKENNIYFYDDDGGVNGTGSITLVGTVEMYLPAAIAAGF